jgi:hypothetical protein
MVDYLLGQGIRQFLDLGPGLPNIAGITRFFDGFTLVEPGLVRPAQWRPGLDDPLRSPQGGDEPALKPSASVAPEDDRGAAGHLCGAGLKSGRG